ncbi:MAG: hypothetical protein NUV47_01190 [Patescibacteria group bacterium]|nr:hypothetical protein [Patescibacteria group bacterium]
MFKTESDLAKAVISWLEDYQWEVYQEVQVFGYTADIIAVQNKLVWVVETKLTSTLKVIEQANNWKGLAHYVSVAVPRRRDQSMFGKVLSLFGIGKIECGQEIIEWIPPILNRKALSNKITHLLIPELKNYAEAGNSEGKRLTPFKKTCMEIIREVEENPGITIKELIERIKTNDATPATARTCVSRWIGTKHIDVRFETEGRKLKLYPKERNFA